MTGLVQVAPTPFDDAQRRQRHRLETFAGAADCDRDRRLVAEARKAIAAVVDDRSLRSAKRRVALARKWIVLKPQTNLGAKPFDPLVGRRAKIVQLALAAGTPGEKAAAEAALARIAPPGRPRPPPLPRGAAAWDAGRHGRTS